MKLRKLGKGGPEVSAVGYGAMGLEGYYGQAAEEKAIEVIRHAVSSGAGFIDTADAYGNGHNEQLVAQAAAGMSADTEIFLASKFGIVFDPAETGTEVPTGWGFSLTINGSPEYARKALEGSLKRLGRPHLDLWYLHYPDPETPIEETVGAMAELVQQGKVRHLGLSEAGPQTLHRACSVHPIAALQTEYSLWSRDPEHEILTTCRELGIGFVAYSPLGRGLLTGQIKRFEDLAADDWRRFAPWFQGENFQKNLDLVTRLESLAEAKGCTAAQLAMAWVLAQGEDIVPIPGTKRVKYLEDNAAAADVELTAEELAELNTAFAGAVAGTRYPEAMMKLVDR